MNRLSPRSRSLTLLAIAFVALWLLPDIAAWLEYEPDEAWARVRSSGVIRFATDASYHPFEGIGSDGVFYGLDIDIAREIARRIGARAEFVNAGMDALYDVLRVGQADASISALPVDPAREGRWAYSRPYFDAGLVLVAPAHSEPQLKIGDLQGRTVVVALGSDGDAWLRKRQREGAHVAALRLDSNQEALEAVIAGRADAAIVDGVAARQHLSTRFADLRIVAQLTSEPYAIAVWGGSTELLAAIDNALSDMQADGTLARIVDTWMRK
ncbi:MAG TPA: ABC transporter substrate-binding protein [Anaerolineae bacterium]|nr:ABC transporter substrate-binding protein [Anaerolineae bacterium]